MDHDMGFIELKDIISAEPKEEKLLMKHTMMNYQMLTEIYHYLQSKSKSYPWIDNYTFRENFIAKMDILNTNGSSFNMRKFDVLMTKAKYTNRFKDKIDTQNVDPPTGISRYMLVELMYRIAKFLFSTEEIETLNAVHVMSLNENSTETVTVSQAFFMFINEKIKPYYDRFNIRQYDFRVRQLMHYDIEIIFSMNETPLKQIFKKKAAEGRGDFEFKPVGSDWMIIEDCSNLLRDECNLNIPFRHIHEAFSLSKRDVVAEFEKESL